MSWFGVAWPGYMNESKDKRLFWINVRPETKPNETNTKTVAQLHQLSNWDGKCRVEVKAPTHVSMWFAHAHAQFSTTDMTQITAKQTDVEKNVRVTDMRTYNCNKNAFNWNDWISFTLAIGENDRELIPSGIKCRLNST